MINLIYGAKGSGKTGKMLAAVNECSATTKANVVFITDNARSLDIDNSVRFVNAKEYALKDDCCLLAFIKGMVAANSDNAEFFIDSVTRILGLPAEKLEEFMTGLENISTEYGINVTAAVTTESLPKFMKKYV